MTLREEIAKQLKFDATHPNLNESYISQADKILNIIEKRIDELIEEQVDDAKWRGNEPDYNYLPIEKIKEMLRNKE